MSIEFYSVGLLLTRVSCKALLESWVLSYLFTQSLPLLPRVSCKDSDRKYTYGFDFYSQAIANRQFHLVKHPDSIWFNFEDDNVDDNPICNRIEMSETTSGMKISVSLYYN